MLCLREYLTGEYYSKVNGFPVLCDVMDNNTQCLSSIVQPEKEVWETRQTKESGDSDFLEVFICVWDLLVCWC